MKMTKWLAIAAATALSAGGLFIGQAQGAEGGIGERPVRGRILERAKAKLGLTEEQVTKIKAELAAEKDTLKALIAKWHEARINLRGAIQASDASEASVRAAAAKVGAAQADLAVERFKLYGRINPILTPEQREKVKAFQGKIDSFVERTIERLGKRPESQ